MPLVDFQLKQQLDAIIAQMTALNKTMSSMPPVTLNVPGTGKVALLLPPTPIYSTLLVKQPIYVANLVAFPFLPVLSGYNAGNLCSLAIPAYTGTTVTYQLYPNLGANPGPTCHVNGQPGNALGEFSWPTQPMPDSQINEGWLITGQFGSMGVVTGTVSMSILINGTTIATQVLSSSTNYYFCIECGPNDTVTIQLSGSGSTAVGTVIAVSYGLSTVLFTPLVPSSQASGSTSGYVVSGAWLVVTWTQGASSFGNALYTYSIAGPVAAIANMTITTGAYTTIIPIIPQVSVISPSGSTPFAGINYGPNVQGFLPGLFGQTLARFVNSTKALISTTSAWIPCILGAIVQKSYNPYGN